MEGNSFIFELVVVLLCAMVGGLIAKKLRQPEVLGQILAGVIVGPSVLGLTIVTQEPIVFEHFAHIGVIMLMFIAGLETDINELKESGKSSLIVAAGGVLVPLGLGTALTYYCLPHINLLGSLFVGVILTATSVSLTVQVLREINKLRSRQGVVILGAAIMDDILGIILLSIISGTVNPEGTGSILMLLLKIGGFFVGSIIMGYVIHKLIIRLSLSMDINEHIVMFAILFCFLMAFISELSEVAGITGAYIAGLILSTTAFRERIASRIQTIAYNVFTPIFFVNLGIGVNLGNMGNSLVFGILLSIVAIFGKILGCGVGAKLSGFKGIEAIQVGVGMVPRAEVALIVVSLGVQLKIIGNDIFAAVIMMVLVTTIITPIVLKELFAVQARRHEKNIAAEQQS
jgi:Kef-type K+ transport system membrane component KefB